MRRPTCFLKRICSVNKEIPNQSPVQRALASSAAYFAEALRDHETESASRTRLSLIFYIDLPFPLLRHSTNLYVFPVNDFTYGSQINRLGFSIHPFGGPFNDEIAPKSHFDDCVFRPFNR